MPPNGDISCKKSSQYHFVNEYLYKPLNLAEAENKPNVTLRYSERYYPADIYTDERDNEFQNTPNRRPVNQVNLTDYDFQPLIWQKIFLIYYFLCKYVFFLFFTYKCSNSVKKIYPRNKKCKVTFFRHFYTFTALGQADHV